MKYLILKILASFPVTESANMSRVRGKTQSICDEQKLNNLNRSLSFELLKINKKEHKLLPSFALIKTWNDISLDFRRKNFNKHFSSDLFEKYANICKVSSCYACRK